ncbi:MAG TPA: methylmalonyl-CoA mutase family protein [Rhizomicrobium sp.]|jgi:(2R)-ethylmalonyl-CoA mutase|nr:methylmalonyl-CoA mutase family protein [Rhizomicrobium sp.]
MAGMKSTRDPPWIFRTYAGHSSAAASNVLYRLNLGKGQTGLSIAFDLPTQTGYDSDHPMAKGEVGKVGVPVNHLGDMRALLEGLPLERMNTSMTINAPAAWLLALYVALADERRTPRGVLRGTTQNDIIKEYLARGTYIFPPRPALRLTSDVIAFTTAEMPKWNPVNLCSYHLQEAGAEPVEEAAFALAAAIEVLDTCRVREAIPPEEFPNAVGRISFFVNSGVRFITEICKLRAMARVWDEIARERYGVDDPKLRLFRYGVQVNSLGLTEQQPENNVYRILFGMLGVTLSKSARARAVQLPAWNEALGLPRPWDQQWSLRLQQIAAFETDLLEYDDIFDGSHVIGATSDRLAAQIKSEIARIEELGGAGSTAALAYMKERLVLSNAARIEAIETAAETRVGVNAFTETEPSPLTSGEHQFLVVNETAERNQVASLRLWRDKHDPEGVKAALATLEKAARSETNIMPASIACAEAGVTTGEWAETLRRVFGEYRAPTGVAAEASKRNEEHFVDLRARVEDASQKLGRRLSLLIAKPGLDGHSNGAEQIAIRARDIGIEITYDGIRFTPEEIVAAVITRRPHVLGLSVLSGSHVPLACDIAERLSDAGASGVRIVAGGIIPEDDERRLKRAGIAAVFTPKDYDLDRIMRQIVELAIAER